MLSGGSALISIYVQLKNGFLPPVLNLAEVVLKETPVVGSFFLLNSPYVVVSSSRSSTCPPTLLLLTYLTLVGFLSLAQLGGNYGFLVSQGFELVALGLFILALLVFPC